MDAIDVFIVPVFGGYGMQGSVPPERLVKGGYTRWKDAYRGQDQIVTYVRRTLTPQTPQYPSNQIMPYPINVIPPQYPSALLT
jgi:hypothetical protein